MKIVLAYRADFQEMYFSMDNFLIPYYIAKEKGLQLHYYYSHNTGRTPIPQQHRGVVIHGNSSKHTISGTDGVKDMFSCIIRNARNIETLFLNGSSAKHMIAIRLYKFLVPQGKVVVFGDMGQSHAQELNRSGFVYSKGILGKLKSYLTNYMFNHSVYIVANTDGYDTMKELCDRKKWKGLLHFYPCLDDELFDNYRMERKTFAEKENIMICVGRIGNYQKNTEMLLDALESVDLKDWKIYMIGPVTSSFDLKEEGNFQNRIESFYVQHPEYKKKLIFTGTIYDQRELFEYYNRAKVLLHTARSEGFANVFSQAAAFGCYILSTDVGGADIASNHWKYGMKLEQECSPMLAAALQAIIDGEVIPNESQSHSLTDMSYSNRIKNVLLPKMRLNVEGS